MSHRSQAIFTWLASRQARELPADALLSQLCERLVASELPVWRVATSVLTKHPEVFVRALIWDAECGCRVELRQHSLTDLPMYKDSPVAKIREGAAAIRCRLAGPDADLHYPVCRELAERGATDYLGLPVDLGAGERTFISWSTKAPGGFSDAELEDLTRITELYALLMTAESARYTLTSLLEVYLGRNAAARVLRGAFKRGGGETIRAAIWFCDMRGFTTMADRTPAAEVVRVLDRFFESVASPISAHGGEILKFIGDAVLAIFPVEGEAGSVCASALAAAEEALVAIDALNADRTDPIGLGIALHLGDVMYGNIGAQDRLDFTVIGAAVNEVTRVEAMCKTLGARVLMTSRFARECGSDRAVSLGRHALRGVSEPEELFTLRA